MTLVLPAFCSNCPNSSLFCSNYPPNSSLFCSNYPSNYSLFSENINVPSMPCGFDSEPLDFESVLFSVEWPSTLRDLPETTQDSDSSKMTAGSACGNSPEGRELPSTDNKRKLHQDEDFSVKRQKKEYEDVTMVEDNKEVNPATTGLVSDVEEKCGENASQHLEKCHDQEMPMDDIMLPTRRRVPQLWNPRMRWKDERRKVLKLSMNKLRRIKDPEGSLCRSVLINNTVKCLQKEIREEKSARHRVMGRTCYVLDSDSLASHSTSRSWTFDAEPSDVIPRKPRSDSVYFSSCSEDITNYDEIFGLDEEVLGADASCRQTRLQTLISEQLVNCDADACTCTTHTNRNVVSGYQKHPQTYSYKGKIVDDHNSRHQTASPNPCATQYRISHDSFLSDGLISQSVSVLDSVVYQSLLASLES
ncbi:uncharacterized protein LOC106462743 [Limulus polyphemus]|uniref:Uncharacterized protein LOC106462743 n=1 Tax=Limulus polyphemus TaxID=6850 RepID=A0ABM1BAJ9_LIMPO|nr:uncharacterized protein LOC106462743 [Limulus polyphemus]